MKYYNIHTHIASIDRNVLSIINYNVGESGSFCGLNLQHMLYSLGLHPWRIKEEYLSKNIDFIEQNAIFNSIKAIGECGLDKLCQTPWNIQKKAFFAQVMISEKLEKPLIIHCVKAFDELIEIKKTVKPKQPWIIHGFKGKPQQAEQLLHHGLFFSFGLEFNTESLLKIPMKRLFLETDDKNIHICEVYQKVSDSLQKKLNDLCIEIEENVKTCFFDC